MKTITSHNIQTLPLMEQFYTIQGEGAYQGQAAYFIRLAGCDVGCVWCDVKESWDVNKHPVVKTKDIIAEASSYPGRIAVVTGGEPLMHDCTNLCEQLHTAGFRTHVETSGAHPLSGSWDWITFSPKKFKTPLPEFYDKADELKVIVYNKHDFEWAETFAQEMSIKCKLYLQPEWGKEEKVLPKIIDYVKSNPKWQISLQIHKYINVP